MHCRKLPTWAYYSPPNTVFVTTLPCKILTRLFIFSSLHWSKKVRFRQCPSPEFFLNLWFSNSIYWCILGAILSATLLNSTGQGGFWRLEGMRLPLKSAYDCQGHARSRARVLKRGLVVALPCYADTRTDTDKR